MRNISFDNPRLLLLFIPAIIIIAVPFFITRNRDNRSLGWNISLAIHTLIVCLVTLALAGIMSETVLTKTTVYVVADLSHSSSNNLDEIDGYISEIKDSLPENASLGVVCFGRDTVIHASAGREIKSVKEVNLDGSRTDIAAALGFTAGLFKGDTLKRIVLITDGLDTSGLGTASLAGTVSRLTEDGIKIDAIFLDTSIKDGEREVQLMGVDYEDTVYLGRDSTVTLAVSSSVKADALVKIERREAGGVFKPEKDVLVSLDEGITSQKIELISDKEGSFDYRFTLIAEGDLSEFNNSYTISRTVKAEKKILLVTGNERDEALLRVAYGESAAIDTRYIPRGDRAPVTLEEILEYDEIILSSLDVRDIRNANSFIASVDKAVSAYGKSFITMGDLLLASDSDDMTFKRLEELLPLKFGSTGKDGRLYTIVLDVSHSMFTASKFTIAKNTAIRLLSVLEDDDYVCLVTFSGEINVKKPTKLRDCKDELIEYIGSLSTGHGTDIGLGLEEALKAVKALNLTENSVMLISDGLSFDSERSAYEVASDLFASGTPVSAVCPYFEGNGGGATGKNNLRRVVNAGVGGKYYEIKIPEDVDRVVFGSVAEDFGSYVIEKSSTVNIVRQRDAAVSGIDVLSNVSKYLLSVAKYDATVPITVTYVKDNGYQETVPLYAYRAHGNGRVSSFATSLSDGWTGEWTAEEKTDMMKNLIDSMTPKKIIDRPFTVSVERSDYSSLITLTPSSPDPDASVLLKITYPEGRSVNRTMAFDSSKYTFTLPTESVGAYRLAFTYEYGDKSYTSELLFDIPYTPEYNSFAPTDKYLVYEFMRDNGETLSGEIPSLLPSEDEITTYKVSYRNPLIIAAIALMLIDVAVRTVRIGKKVRSKTNKEA